MADSTALVLAPENGVDTFRTATNSAALCAAIVKQTAVTIQGRKYVKAEGWQAIAIANGCVASARDVEKVADGIRAIGEVRRMADGALVATAEGFLGDDEPTWAKRPMFARRAMAQTRAISRACRSAFAPIVVMIDKDLGTTPAEEMQGVLDHEPDSVLNSGTRAIDQTRADIIAQTGDGRSTYQVNKEKKERAAQVTLYKSAKQAISMCGTRPELDEWWRENQATLEDKLPDAGFQEIVTALDARRSDLPPM